MKQPTIKWLPAQNGWCVFDPNGNKLAAFERNFDAVDFAKEWMDKQEATSKDISKGLQDSLKQI